MSDGDVDTSCSSSAETSFESSMISKPPTSPLVSELQSCTSRTSSSPMMHNFLNYDPPENHPNKTFYISFTYFISRSIGLGFLCLPYEFMQVGMFIGLVLCIITGLMFTYSFTTLVERGKTESVSLSFRIIQVTRYKLCQIHRVPTVQYQNLIEYSLRHGPRVIRWLSPFFRFTFMATNLTLNFGKSCLYTRFVSSAIHELFTDMGFSVNLFNVSLGLEVVFLVFLLLPYGEYLTPLRIFSNMACAILLSFIFYYTFTSDTDISCQTLFCGNLTDALQFFGILLFTFIPINEVFKIEDGLSRQEDFARQFNFLNISMIVMTNLYIAIGLCGYLDHHNLPIIGNSILKFMPSIRCQTIIKSCVAVNVMFFHRELNLESTLLWASSMKVAKVKSNNKKCQNSPSTECYSPMTVAGLSAFTKILFTFCSFFVNIAVTSPVTNNFHVIVGLIGYLGNACNMLIYPYIVELCLTHALHGMSTRPYVIAKDVCFVLLGLSVFACGTSALVLRLVYSDL